jgi:RNA-directed DNA polymerase
MHVTEESHSGIVPMNHSNKDENASAESGERVSQGLAGVRKAAGNNKEMKFTALLPT